MTTLRSGIQVPAGSTTVTRENNNVNLYAIDKLIRDDYREKVVLASWDATAKLYTTVEYYRPEAATLYCRCVLSDKTGGNYLTDTWTFYADDGTTPTRTITWTLTYDANANVVDKVPVVV